MKIALVWLDAKQCLMRVLSKMANEEEPEHVMGATSMNNNIDKNFLAGQADASRALDQLLLKKNKNEKIHRLTFAPCKDLAMAVGIIPERKWSALDHIKEIYMASGSKILARHRTIWPVVPGLLTGFLSILS